MVMLKNNDLDTFPWFHRYLEEFNSVRFDSKRWEAFLEWSGLSENDAATAISYGTFPIINIKPTLSSPHDHGHFNPNFPDDIWIRRDSVQTYEHTEDEARAFQTAKYLEKLILHELVHWGRNYAALGDDFEYDGNDSGDMFENAAYSNPNLPHLG